MYTTIKKEDAVKYDKLKLCYVDEINQTYWDYTPEAKVYRETEEWKEQDRLRTEKLHREGFLSSNDPEFGWGNNLILERGSEGKNYPNPEYIEGKQEYYAYFTPVPLNKQWGDVWDDAPYEYNAEIPYDDVYDENDERAEIEIVRVPFYIPYDGGWSIRFPKDWGGDNSLFCVRDINAGAVAWIFCHGGHRKSNTDSVAIHAGCSPSEFVEKINKINEFKKEDEAD
jgi:hypothetical protein